MRGVSIPAPLVRAFWDELGVDDPNTRRRRFLRHLVDSVVDPVPDASPPDDTSVPMEDALALTVALIDRVSAEDGASAALTSPRNPPVSRPEPGQIPGTAALQELGRRLRRSAGAMGGRR